MWEVGVAKRGKFVRKMWEVCAENVGSFRGKCGKFMWKLWKVCAVK